MVVRRDTEVQLSQGCPHSQGVEEGSTVPADTQGRREEQSGGKRGFLAGVYWSPEVIVTKHHKLEGLKQEKCIVSGFWKLGVQSQGVSRSVFSLKALGRIFS